MGRTLDSDLFDPQRELVSELLQWFEDVVSRETGNLALDLPGAPESGRSTVLEHFRRQVQAQAEMGAEATPKVAPAGSSITRPHRGAP